MAKKSIAVAVIVAKGQKKGGMKARGGGAATKGLKFSKNG